MTVGMMRRHRRRSVRLRRPVHPAGRGGERLPRAARLRTGAGPAQRHPPRQDLALGRRGVHAAKVPGRRQGPNSLGGQI